MKIANLYRYLLSTGHWREAGRGAAPQPAELNKPECHGMPKGRYILFISSKLPLIHSENRIMKSWKSLYYLNVSLDS